VVAMAGECRNVRKRTDRQRAPTPASSRWKRPLVWTGSVAGTLILAVAAAFGTGLGQKLFDTITTGYNASPSVATGHNANLPVIADATYLQQFPGSFTVGFPSGENPPSLREGSSNSFQRYMAEVNKRGGALVAPAYIQVILRGNRPGPVVISDMRVIKHCQAPLPPQFRLTLWSGVQIFGISFNLDFNLDRTFPVAQTDKLGTLSPHHPCPAAMANPSAATRPDPQHASHVARASLHGE
jgi:hypothetical protein